MVERNDKRRFTLSEDGARIRAAQGHSVPVRLEYEPRVPPELLYHGTVARALPLIRETGLIKGKRHHVHLSPDEATARAVGERRGAPMVLSARAGAMHRRGFVFCRSDNGVWLTEQVPPEFIAFPPGS